MQPLHSVVAILILLVSGTRAIADSFAPSMPEAFPSPSGKYIVRIEAADSVENPRLYWKSTEFNVFSYNEKAETYDRVTKFDVEGHPLLVFVDDAGTHIITIDQSFGVGHGQIAAIYNFEGRRLAQWTLKDLFKVENLFDPRKATNFRRSTSSIYWRGDASWNDDQKSIRISAPAKLKLHDDGSCTETHPADIDSYVIDLGNLEMRRVPPKTKKAEQ